MKVKNSYKKEEEKVDDRCEKGREDEDEEEEKADRKPDNVFKKFHPLLFHHTYKHSSEILSIANNKVKNKSKNNKNQNHHQQNNDQKNKTEKDNDEEKNIDEKYKKRDTDFMDILSPTPDSYEGQLLGDRMEKFWQEELRNQKKPSLLRALFKTTAFDFITGFLLNFIIRCVIMIIIIDLLRLFLIIIEQISAHTDQSQNSNAHHDTSTIIDHHDDKHKPTIDSNYSLTTTNNNNTNDNHHQQIRETLYQDLLNKVILELFMKTLFLITFSYCKLERTARGVKCRIALTQLIFRKCKKLKLETSIKQSSSVAIDLISNDVTMLEEANNFFCHVIIAPIILFGGTLWIGIVISGVIPVLVSYLVMIIPVGIEIYTPMLYKKYSNSRSVETKQKVEIMAAFLNAVKVAKMYAWERVFRKMIETVRIKEMAWYKKLDSLVVVEMLTIGCLMRLLPTVVWVFHIYLYDELNAVVLIVGSAGYQYFVAEGLFGITVGMKAVVDFQTTCKKIQAFLLLPEREEEGPRPLEVNLDINQGKPASTDILCEKVVLAYDDCHGKLKGKSTQNSTRSSSRKSNKMHNYLLGCVKRDKESTAIESKLNELNNNSIIENLTIHMKQSELIMVIGQVGSGKSTLLLSLLGELRPKRGEMANLDRLTIAYAAQEPWIHSDTIRNNILLGRRYDAVRYKRVIGACSLTRDLSLLPNGDETQVGSKGISLSGGQKARVNLARAVYGEADVYLLDDPLSAVDSKVSKHLFNNCLKKFLAGKIIILATHQRQYIQRADQVIALERGCEPKVGNPKDILRACPFLLNDPSETNKHAKNNDQPKSNDDAQAVAAYVDDDEANLEFLLGGDKDQRIRYSLGFNRRSESAYLILLKNGFSKLSICMTILVFSCYSPLNGFIDYFMRIWRNQIVADRAAPDYVKEDFKVKLLLGCLVYLAISGVSNSLLSVLQFQILSGMRKASNKLHKKLLCSLFSAKMSFYDFCPPGNLGARYAADFTQIDHVLKPVLLNAIQMFSWMFGFVIILGYMQPICGFLYLLLFTIFGPRFFHEYKSLIKLANMNKQLRAPLYTQIAPVVDDLDTLRSNPNYMNYINEKFHLCQNRYTTMSLLAVLYETRLSTLVKLPILFVTFASYWVMFVWEKDQLEAGKTGVFFMMIANTNFYFPLFIEFLSTADSSMRSIESVQQLLHLEPEEDLKNENEPRDDDDEPTRSESNENIFKSGRIEFKQVTLKYNEDERQVLSDLSFIIEAGQRVGVVGRTGAGKSSVVSLLFRLYPFDGSIEIDGIDTKDLTLAQLRASLGVIPQEPVLFSDSLRKNLDPFGKYSDEKLWQALEVVELKKHISSNLSSGLDHQISEGGRNFSLGQRQLVCLARAILKSPKVLVMDEATASVDQDTDMLIQRTIEKHFASSTVVTIAHRLNTILDYDKILVMDAGKIVEYDSVDNLLAKKDGLFKAMLESSAATKAN